MNEDPRTAFVRSLPRKVVEVKATLGAVIADPASGRMRDELRRRINAFLALARSYQFPTLAEALRAIVDLLDQHRGESALPKAQLDRLAGLVASLAPRAELDAREGDADSHVPSGTRSELPGPMPQPVGPMVTPGEGLDPVARALGARGGSFPALSRALTGALPASALQILIVGSAARVRALADTCGGEVEVVGASSLDEALARARETAPDVVVAECAPPADGVELVRALRAEPLTDFIPVLLVAPPDATIGAVWERCHDAHDVLGDDVSPNQIRRAAERAVRGGTSLPPPNTQDLGELSLDELVRALQDEIKRGLAGAATPQARAAKVPLGTGSEVLAATWDAITRIREVVERRSDGNVRFDLPSAPRGLPGTEVFTVGRTAVTVDPRDLAQDPLPGRRALVVDDDPTVTEQFAALLREGGMEVYTCGDGETALREARRLRPDVVVSDILMPGLDGFGLCRAIRRDVVLRNTPVILISWKDDLLGRMRELGARAAGYLRKEAPGEAILSRVRAAIRMRVRSLQRVAALGWGSVFRGRLERVGVVPLIETAARALGDAEVTLTDAASVTQLELRGGALVSATRTLQDGALVRGEAALLQALGAPSGRFSVERSSQPVRENLSGALGAVLERCAARVEALETALEGAALLDVRRVDLEPEAALGYARTLPTAMRGAVERLVQGDPPRELVRRDGLSPKDLEPLLAELARRGAIQRVIGADGRDVSAPPADDEVRRAPPLTPPVSAATSPRARLRTEPGVSPGALNADAAPIAKITRRITTPDEDAPRVDSLADAVWRELRETVDEPARKHRETIPVEPSHFARGTAAEESWADVPVTHGVWAADPASLRSSLPDVMSLLSALPDEVTAADAPTPAAPEAPREAGERATLTPGGDEDLDDAHGEPLAGADPEQTTKVTVVDLAAAFEAEGEATDDDAHESLESRLRATFNDDDPEAEAEPMPLARRASHPPSTEPPPPVAPDAIEEISAADVQEAPAPTSPDDDEPQRLSMSEVELSASDALEPDGEDLTRAGEPSGPRGPRPGETSLFNPSSRPPPAPSVPPVVRPSGRAAAHAQAATRSAAPAPADEGSWWLRPLLLLVLVGSAFVISYLAVYFYTREGPRPAQQTPASALPPVPIEPAAAAPDPTPAPDPAEPANGAANLVPTAGDTRDAAPFLDGGTLEPGQGLIVVRGPRRGASAVDVTVDQQPVGRAPLVLRQPVGFHRVRFRAGIITSFQSASVREGQATVLDPPSDR